MCTYLEEVPDVDDEGAGDGLDGHPPGALHELQAADVVLAEHGEEVAVGVRHQAEGVRGHRARRVPVQPEEARRLVAPLGREPLRRRPAPPRQERLREHARQRAGQLRHRDRHLPRHVPAAATATSAQRHNPPWLISFAKLYDVTIAPCKLSV